MGTVNELNYIKCVVYRENYSGLKEEHFTFNKFKTYDEAIFWAQHCNMSPDCNYVVTKLGDYDTGKDFWNRDDTGVLHDTN